MIGTARILFVVLIVFLFTVPLLPVQYLSVRFERFFHKSLPRFWHRVIAKLLGLRVHVTGSLVDDRPLLIVANHSSWADIIVLSTVAEVSFIAKSEVRNWPLFGMFAVLQRSVFVDRERKHRSGQQANTIAERLAKGDAMVLFAEGTTSDGNRVLPFKSSLFGAAQLALRDTDSHRVLIQPVSIAYTKVHGLPLGRYMRPVASWSGSLTLLPSLYTMLREGALDVEIRVGEPIEFTPKSSRKAVACDMEAKVRVMMLTSLMGRPLSQPILNEPKSV